MSKTTPNFPRILVVASFSSFPFGVIADIFPLVIGKIPSSPASPATARFLPFLKKVGFFTILLWNVPPSAYCSISFLFLLNAPPSANFNSDPKAPISPLKKPPPDPLTKFAKRNPTLSKAPPKVLL